MRNRLTKREHFEKYLQLSDNEKDGFKVAQNKLSVSVTPYFFNLIDPNNPNCPVRKQVIPSAEESISSNIELKDPVGEEDSMRCARYCS